MPDTMDSSKRTDFRLYCQQTTDSQLEAIVEDEQNRARSERAKGDGSDYYQQCLEIAKNEQASRERSR